MKTNPLVMLFSLLLLAIPVQAERIKDMANVAGVRDNQLLGYGLVVGLDGTGDQTTQTPFTVQSLKSMLTKLGVALPADLNPQVKNVAAVTVNAVLPPFSKPGQSIDVTVSSIGNAKSLRGGTLLLTPLKGLDGNIYAIAQGNLVVGGFGAAGADAGADPGWDLIDVEGQLEIIATEADPFSIDITSLTPSNNAGDAVNFSDGSRYAWTIVRTSGGIIGFSSEKFLIRASNFFPSSSPSAKPEVIISAPFTPLAAHSSRAPRT